MDMRDKKQEACRVPSSSLKHTDFWSIRVSLQQVFPDKGQLGTQFSSSQTQDTSKMKYPWFFSNSIKVKEGCK